MDRAARTAGVPLAVVMIPERFQVYPEYRTEPDLDYEKPQRLFSEFFEQQGIPYLDLLPVLTARAESSDELLYYERDSHFTKTGYRVSGEAIASFLQSSKLLSRVRQKRD